MTLEDEPTITPTKQVMAKPQGIVISCGQKGVLGVLENLVKSGLENISDRSYFGCWTYLFTMSVAKFDRHDMMEATKAHPRVEPEREPG